MPTALPGEPRALRLLAPAKINLHLRVGPPTPDGFHPLLTWMCTVALFDTLILSRGTAQPSRVVHGGGSLVELSCDDPSVPCDGSNLVARTARALARALRGEEEEKRDGGEAEMNASTPAPARPSSAPVSPSATREVRDADVVGTHVGRAGDAQHGSDLIGAQGSSQGSRAAAAIPKTTTTPISAPSGIGASLTTIKVSLHKRIPAGAGLGGGSSDGARAMLGLARLWNADAGVDGPVPGGLGRDRLAALAATCGSDLAFFFHGPSCACTGRGELVRPVPPPAVARWAVLVLPAMAMPTPAVYRKFDELRLGDVDRLAAEPDWVAWAKLSSNQLLPLLVNDLEAPAFAIRPELGVLRAEVEAQLGRIVRMSGSGSSLFTLFDAEADARVSAAEITSTFGVRAAAVEVAPNLDDDLGNVGEGV